MRHISFIAAVTLLLAAPAQAQQQPQRFDPIVLDEPRMNELSAAIDEIQMPPPVYRRLMGVFQRFEQRAQADADKAKAAEQVKPKE